MRRGPPSIPAAPVKQGLRRTFQAGGGVFLRRYWPHQVRRVCLNRKALFQYPERMRRIVSPGSALRMAMKAVQVLSLQVLDALHLLRAHASASAAIQKERKPAPLQAPFSVTSAEEPLLQSSQSWRILHAQLIFNAAAQGCSPAMTGRRASMPRPRCARASSMMTATAARR